MQSLIFIWVLTVVIKGNLTALGACAMAHFLSVKHVRCIMGLRPNKNPKYTYLFSVSLSLTERKFVMHLLHVLISLTVM